LSALALADHGTYGELKSMFVEEASRGQGIADAIMRQIEIMHAALITNAASARVTYVAHKVYAPRVHMICGPFGTTKRTNFNFYGEISVTLVFGPRRSPRRWLSSWREVLLGWALTGRVLAESVVFFGS
jgi:GNAT superfamily N-acetyltransferase